MAVDRQRFLSGLLLLVGLSILLVLFWHFGFDELLNTLSRARPSLLMVYAVIAFLVAYTNAWRWRYLSSALGKAAPLSRFLAARVAGDAVGIVVPSARVAGDPIRIALLYGEGAVGDVAIAGVTIDRVVETIANTICTIVYVLVFLLAGSATSMSGGGLGFVLFMCVPLIAFGLHFAAMRRGSQPFVRFLGRPIFNRPGLVGRLSAFLRRIEADLFVIIREHSGRFTMGIVAALATQALIVLMYLALFRAFEVHLSLPVLLLSFVATGFARAVPTPGGLGSLEAAQVGVMSFTNNSPELGLVVGILMRLHDVVWTALGMAVLLSLGVSLARVGRPGQRDSFPVTSTDPIPEQPSQKSW